MSVVWLKSLAIIVVVVSILPGVFSQTCEEDCASIDKSTCLKPYIRICKGGPDGTELEICSDSSEPFPPGTCENLGGRACVCDNPPPECEPCETVIESANCTRNWIHSCAATPDFLPLCTNSEDGPPCGWGKCTCENPPPPCEPCEDVIAANPDCRRDWIHSCGGTPEFLPQCTSSDQPSVPCDWGYCACENPPPPCEPCEDVIAANPDCDRKYIHSCYGTPEFLPQCSDSDDGPPCEWGKCTCALDGSSATTALVPFFLLALNVFTLVTLI